MNIEQQLHNLVTLTDQIARIKSTPLEKGLVREFRASIDKYTQAKKHLQLWEDNLVAYAVALSIAVEDET